MAGYAGPGFFSRAIRSCQTGAVSVRAICTCVTTSGDRIDEINCEKNAFISQKAIAAAGFLFFVGEAGLPPSQLVALPIKARTS